MEFFVRDIEDGIAGTGVRAGMLKVVTDRPGLTADVRRVMAAAAVAHQQTGVPITDAHPRRRHGTAATSSRCSPTTASRPSGWSSATAATARTSTTCAS